MLPKVKICGITTVEDIDIINTYKPEYAGFVFYVKSKRNLTYEQAKLLLGMLDKDIVPVAVVVSPDAEFITPITELGFPILQVHGNLSDEVVDKWQGEIWQAVNISGDSMPIVRRDIKVSGYVVDGANYGGGEAFDWQEKHIFEAFGALKQKDEMRILAGGLNLSNLRIGIERFSPDVVDVSSGVEAAVGKDREKVKAFIETARGLFESQSDASSWGGFFDDKKR